MNEKNLKILATILLFVGFFLFALIILNSNLRIPGAHAIKIDIHADVIQGEFETGMDAEGPYAFLENFVLFTFGILLLSIAYFIFKKANQRNEDK